MIIAIDIASWFEPGTTIGRLLPHFVHALGTAGTGHRYVLLVPDTARPSRRRSFKQQVLGQLPPGTRVELLSGGVPGPIAKAGSGRWFCERRTRALEKLGVDVLLFFHPTLVSFLPDKPDFVTATSIYDLIALRMPDFVKPAVLERTCTLLKEQAGNADLLLAASETTKRDIISELGVPGERVRVLYPGITGAFRPRPGLDRTEVRGRLGLPEKFILFVGRLDPWKNVTALLGAFRILLGQGAGGLHLVLAGPRDWGYPALAATVEEWDLGDRVHFTGYVEDEDLPLLYNLAECFVFPSWYEGFGLPVVEALASGCPVVISTTPALREVSAGTALEADPADIEGLSRAIGSAVSEPDRRAAMVEKGLERASEFTWERAARRALEELGALAGRDRCA